MSPRGRYGRASALALLLLTAGAVPLRSAPPKEAPPAAPVAPAPKIDPLDEALRSLRRAYERIETGDGAGALEALPPFEALPVPLRVHWRRARTEALLLGRQDEAAIEELSRALQADPPAAMRLLLLQRLLYLARGMGQGASAAKRIADEMALVPKMEEMPALLLAAASTLRDEGHEAEALAVFRRVAVDHPASAESSEAEEAVDALAAKLKAPAYTGEERLLRAHAFRDSGRNASLKREIAEIRKLSGFTPSAEEREFLAKAWGHALLQTGAVAEALGALRSYEREREAHPDAVYDLAVAFGKSGDPAKKNALFESILRTVPPGEPATRRAVREKVGTEMAVADEADSRFREAGSRYLEMANLFRESARRDEYLFRGGFLSWLSGDAAAAAMKAFTEICEAHAGSPVTPMALFFRARLHASAGNAEAASSDLLAAARDWPRSYHGRLAAEALKKAVEPRAVPEPPAFIASWRESVLHLGPRGEAALLLRAAGLPELALMEAQELPAIPASLLLQALLCGATGKYQRSRELVRQAAPEIAGCAREALPREIWGCVYPLDHAPLVEREARKHGLSKFLLFGLIFQESSFEAEATSRSGAMGLMQLMPGTASDLARQMKVAGFETGRAYDPDLNVAMGTEYLATLLRRFDGSLILALAAYNGGPSRAERTWARLATKDPQVFIESIHIKETRLYVKKVLEAKEEYERIWGP